MRKKHGLFISLLLAASSLLVYSACSSPHKVKVEEADGEILMVFEELGIDEMYETELEKGDYEVEVRKTKNNLNILIQDEKDLPVFMAGSIEDGTYDLEIRKTGGYKIILSGGNSAGTVIIRRK